MEYINRFIQNIVDPAIYFIFALALLYFIYGMVLFIKGADDEEARTTGRRHMLWSVVGLAIMVSVYAILAIITGTVGVGKGSANSVKSIPLPDDNKAQMNFFNSGAV